MALLYRNNDISCTVVIVNNGHPDSIQNGGQRGDRDNKRASYMYAFILVIESYNSCIGVMSGGGGKGALPSPPKKLVKLGVVNSR